MGVKTGARFLKTFEEKSTEEEERKFQLNIFIYFHFKLCSQHYMSELF